ncbi:hypothetical protein HanHA300_Chr13g0478741 [Helianthus annuus]|nr:hypothetical protein HanHA300_Chr13g0478741 [Helianthus annuus]KAJ0663403.1 hypothetical protein HanLR1_Chr13g0480861 [Helianthus annuus]KAJ0848839.1 hypothetical protein HanPSC8_Chr13g0562151 [Helianthus annuus]
MLVGGSIVANAILEDYTTLARREEETIQLRAKAEALMKTAQAAEEHLEKQKAKLEKLKKTEEWAASSDLKQVHSLATLLTEECKLWKEACARENEKLFHLRQKLNNLKAVNATPVKEKTAAEAAVKEAEARGAAAIKDAEARVAAAVKELADANADRSNLNKTVEELQIVEAILDAPENTAAVANVNERARHAGFKAGYN